MCNKQIQLKNRGQAPRHWGLEYRGQTLRHRGLDCPLGCPHPLVGCQLQSWLLCLFSALPPIRREQPLVTNCTGLCHSAWKAGFSLTLSGCCSHLECELVEGRSRSLSLPPFLFQSLSVCVHVPFQLSNKSFFLEDNKNKQIGRNWHCNLGHHS